METKNLSLKHAYVSVRFESGASYGGNQAWFDDWTLRKYGCGAVALGDVLLYLERRGSGCTGELPKEEYLHYIEKMNKLYIHVLPGIGVPGVILAGAANVWFKLNKKPYRARYCIQGRKLTERVERSIAEDTPVMLAVGKNLHFWQKRKLPLYRLKKGEYKKASQTSGHMVVVTGLADGYFRVSSWGRRYYISVDEYLEYAKNSSSFLISNIISVKKKKEKKGKRER